MKCSRTRCSLGRTSLNAVGNVHTTMMYESHSWFHYYCYYILDGTGTNFRGANLKGSRFYRANLKGADFSSADLSAASLEDTLLVDADFTDAILEVSDDLV